MQCPSCGGTSLALTNDGKQVCDDCGEELTGFQEEQVDFNLIGTAVSNRQSQSFQAKNLRQRIESQQTIPADTVLNSLNAVADDVLVCEGVYIFAKAITKKLIGLRYVHNSIKPPLFQIISRWVRRRHDGGYARTAFKTFQPVHVLSMICLASLYIRSPMLPRDICRLVYTQQIPFNTALRTVFPDSFSKSKLVRKAFTPHRLPLARQVIKAAILITEDVHCWSPLKSFFLKNNTPKQNMFHSREPKPAFPLGHLHITLLRLTRLLGLPDNFGERVLRYMELRYIAVKMSRVLKGSSDGPWDTSKVDTCEAIHIPSLFESQAPFAKVLTNISDLYSHPTDESLQIDFINTMRICYGREHNNYILLSKSVCNESLLDLQKEWACCKRVMYNWLLKGSAEDFDAVSWTSMSPNVLATIQGEKLTKYTKSIDFMLSERGEGLPELWGPLAATFEDIGYEKSGNLLSEGNSFTPRDEVSHCMYKREDAFDEVMFAPTEGLASMNEQYAATCKNEGHNSQSWLRPWEKLTSSDYVILGDRKEESQKNLEQSKEAVISQSLLNSEKLFPDRQSSQDIEPSTVTESLSQILNVPNGDKSRCETFSEDHAIGVRERLTHNQDRVNTKVSLESTRDKSVENFHDALAKTRHGQPSSQTLSRANNCDPVENNTEVDFAASNNVQRHEETTLSLNEENRPLFTSEQMGAKSEGLFRIPRKRKRDADTESHHERKNETTPEKSKKQRTRSKRRRHPRSTDFLFEPAGIGLAWTILARFFNGCSVEVEGMELGIADRFPIHRFRSTCDATLAIVIRYVLGLKQPAHIGERTQTPHSSRNR